MKEHVVIGKDRTVVVPDSIRKLGVQHDHNVNTITFDCPRYADDENTIDMSQMQIFVNYMLPNNTVGAYRAINVRINDTDDTLMHFDWKITNNVTPVNGVLSTLICIKETDEEGNEDYHWNTELIQRFTVGAGMECVEAIAEEHPDVITQILSTLDTTGYEVSELNERVGIVEEGLVAADKSVNELKSDLDNNREYCKGKFAQGRITGNAFSDNIKYRIATTESVIYGRPVTLKAKDGFCFYIHSVDKLSNGAYDSGVVTEFAIVGGERLNICIRRVTETTTKLADVEYFRKQVYTDSELLYTVLNNKSDISIMKSKIVLSDKKICFIGDSMIDVVSTLKPWWQYVADYFGIETVYNRGIGGTKICADGTYSLINADGTVHTQNWTGDDADIPTGCTKIIKSLSRADRANTIPTDTDILVIMAGVNDYNANCVEGDFTYYDEEYKQGFYNVSTEFKQAYSAFLQYVYNRIPNATIVLCTLLNSANTKGAGLTPIYSLPTNLNGNTPKDVRDWTIDIANQFGYFCIDTFSTSGINYLNRNDYCVDGVHPYTEQGQKMIARAVIKGISDIKCLADI